MEFKEGEIYGQGVAEECTSLSWEMNGRALGDHVFPEDLSRRLNTLLANVDHKIAKSGVGVNFTIKQTHLDLSTLSRNVEL